MVQLGLSLPRSLAASLPRSLPPSLSLDALFIPSTTFFHCFEPRFISSLSFFWLPLDPKARSLAPAFGAPRFPGSEGISAAHPFPLSLSNACWCATRWCTTHGLCTVSSARS